MAQASGEGLIPRHSASRSSASDGKTTHQQFYDEDLPADDTDGVPPPAASNEEQSKVGLSKWYELLDREFGSHYLVFLACAQWVTKGFVHRFGELPFQYMMRDYGIDAARFGILEGVIGLPWALKPAMGVLADCVPINGYSRIPYILIATIIGVFSACGIAVFQKTFSIEMLVLLLFGCSYYVSMVDLLSEAIYAKSLRQKPQSGPRLMSFVYGGIYLGGILATIICGYMLTVTKPYKVFYVSAPFAALVAYPTIMNWAGDAQMTNAQQVVQRERLMSQKAIIALAFIMMVCTVVLSISGIYASIKQNAVVSAIVAVVVLTSFSLALNPMIAKVNAFSLIQTTLSLSLGGSAFYFMTDSEKQYPKGPHFSKAFYNLILPITGSIFSLIGIWIYNQYSHHITYQKLFMVGNLIGAFVNSLDCLFYARLNLELGISDHVFVLGASTLQSVILNWMWMPGVILTSQLCPRGMEAIMFANLAGCHNLGTTLSKNFGALLLEYMGIKPTGAADEGGMFSDLWKLSLLACLLPLLPVMLIPWFIPNKTSTEAVVDHDMLPNEGSPLQRWGLDTSAPPSQARDAQLIGAAAEAQHIA
jgi:folate/biopterin transporter